jgi:hypothetical protein
MSYAQNDVLTNTVFDSIGILEKEVENLIPLLSPQYQRPALSVCIDQMEGGTRKIVKSKSRLINIYRQENDYPAGTISASSQTGSNISIQFTNGQFAEIPEQHMVFAESGAIGKVEQKGEGYMLVSFYSNPSGATSFNFSTDFLAGEQVTDGGMIGNLAVRKEDETIFSLPDNTQNIIPTYSADTFLHKEDFINTTFLKDATGGYHYAVNKDVQTLERLMQQYCVRTYKNVPAVLSGNQPVAASLVNQIVTMGGTYRPLNSQLTYGELKATIREYTSKGGFTTNEVAVFAGSQYVADFQEALESFVTTAGVNNTLGGQKVEGINIMQYNFQNLNIKLIHDPILDNKLMFGTGSDGFSKRSRSAIWMNTAPVKVEGGGTMPFAVSYYVGENADIHRWVKNGSIDEKGRRVKEGNEFIGCKIMYEWDKLEQISNPRAALFHGSAQ